MLSCIVLIHYILNYSTIKVSVIQSKLKKDNNTRVLKTVLCQYSGKHFYYAYSSFIYK